jgi:hypothetical protein
LPLGSGSRHLGSKKVAGTFDFSNWLRIQSVVSQAGAFVSPTVARAYLASVEGTATGHTIDPRTLAVK